FPGIQGGPLMHVIAAKAVALKEALSDEFRQYQQQIVKNAAALAQSMDGLGYRIIAGGTDNHLFMVDLRSKNVTGKEASAILDQVQITVNKNLIPFDPQKPTVTSGIRIGTPAVTTRGMKEEEMEQIAYLIDHAIMEKDNAEGLEKIAEVVHHLAEIFPIYKRLRD
ncbi:MAG: serine hydroxymethyltransferase, partial [Candidatus Omnitrophica bacterium]|nr:serine hydroxymethyltransferase [Candidatus Omnitrophota bacterium]